MSDQTSLPLPARALQATMKRYAREIDEELLSNDLDGIKIDNEFTLKRFRFHARVDAEGRDYLAWCSQSQTTTAALSRDIAAALRYLANAATPQDHSIDH